MNQKLEKILKKILLIGKVNEKEALLEEAKNRLGGGAAVYACLAAVSVYNKAREVGEEWTTGYSNEIVFLRDLIAKAQNQ